MVKLDFVEFLRGFFQLWENQKHQLLRMAPWCELSRPWPEQDALMSPSLRLHQDKQKNKGLEPVPVKHETSDTHSYTQKFRADKQHIQQ